MPLFILFTLIATEVLAAEKSKIKYPHAPSEFKIISLNSPVNQSKAKFKIETTNKNIIDQAQIKLINTNYIGSSEHSFSKASVTNSELSFSVAQLPPGFYRLYVKLKFKNKKGESAYSSHLHDYVRLTINDSTEVPAPNKRENDSSIKGIDSDNDGIRDDIQRYINQKFSDQNIILALKQAARASQSTLVNVRNKQTAVELVARETKSMFCLSSKTTAFSDLLKQIHSQLLNTKARVKKHLEVNTYMHGETWPQDLIDYQTSGIDQADMFCEFEPL